jgi:hypothetical protein
MNKIILILLIAILFTIPVGFSNYINLPNTSTLVSGNSLGKRIKAFDSDGYWWLNYYINPNIKIAKYDYDFSSLSSTTIRCNGATSCIEMDCNIRNGINYNTIDCLAESLISDVSFERYNITFDTYTSSTGGATTSPVWNTPSVCNDLLLRTWKPTVTASNLAYTLTNNRNGDGYIILPSSYQNPADTQLLTCGGNYHIFTLKNGKVYDLLYSYNLTYLSPYLLTPTDWNISTYDWGVTEIDNKLYVVMENVSGLLNFQAWGCSGNSLSNIFTETHAQTDFEPTSNTTNYMQRPFLTRDHLNGYKLFYEWVKPSAQSEIRVAYNTSCSFVCTGWTATNECFESLRKFNRTCYPTECETNTSYWSMDSYCIDGVTCESAWVCLDENTRAFRQVDCSYTSESDCTGGTPYCFDGNCVAGCTRGYTCFDSVTQGFVDTNCQQSETVNCNSTGYGYCYGGRCYTEVRPAFEEGATTLDIIETVASGVKRMLALISPPLFYILLAIAVTMLIMGVIGLIVAVAKKV